MDMGEESNQPSLREHAWCWYIVVISKSPPPSTCTCLLNSACVRSTQKVTGNVDGPSMIFTGFFKEGNGLRAGDEEKGRFCFCWGH